MSNDPGCTRFDGVAREVIEPVRRYLARRTDPATADDVLSEVLVALWRRIDSVPDGSEIPWAIGVARLQLQNALRSARRQHRLVARIMTVDPPREAALDDDDPAVELVHSALTRLKDAEAELLRLHVWEELTVLQIAAVLGLTTNAVSIRLHRAKKRLADTIRKLQAEPGHAQMTNGDPR